MRRIGLSWGLLAGLIAPVYAAMDDAAEFRARIATRFPNIQVQSVQAAAVPGLFEVRYPGGVLYFSADMRYAIKGTLYEVASNRDLTEPALKQSRLDALADRKSVV